VAVDVGDVLRLHLRDLEAPEADLPTESDYQRVSVAGAAVRGRWYSSGVSQHLSEWWFVSRSLFMPYFP